MAADRMLALLPTAAILIDRGDGVRMANGAAVSMGIVKRQRLQVAELEQLVRAVRRTGAAQTLEFDIDQGGFPRRVLTVGARAQPLDDGEVALVVDDLTESKRVDAVRRDFVANVGHEIKTPVGALTLLAEAALDAHDDPDAVHHFLTRMQREASRLSRLVQELLDLSRLQGGETPPAEADVSIDAVVDEAIDRARLVAEVKQIEIVRGGDSGCLVVGSENQLVTALSNLLDNAIAYSADRTEVAVGVHRREAAVEIAVRDQGIGIDAADQERIFEQFERTESAAQVAGLGLGLYIARQIAQAHQGRLEVRSAPNEGAEFILSLPLPAPADPA